jgi:hypothetical protein
MTGPIAAALDELSRAIDRMERASVRQASKADLTTEMALIRADRQKLAEALDEALARAKGLDAARLTAQEKIDKALGAVKDVLNREPMGRS